MEKNPSGNLPEVLILIIIRIHFREWKVVVVCRPTGRRVMRIRISYLKFSECQWEVVVVLVGIRRGVKIMMSWYDSYNYNDTVISLGRSGCASDFDFPYLSQCEKRSRFNSILLSILDIF